MSAHTGISWTDRTWNPVVGCTKVSQGCKHCYAKTLHDMRHKAYLAGKLQNVPQYAEPFETVQTIPARLTDPLRWRKPSRVFVNSMSDLFHEQVPDPFIAAVFGIMAAAPQHTFQVLTKRPERMRSFLCGETRPSYASLGEWAYYEARNIVGKQSLTGRDPWQRKWPLPNVWLGVSAENQAAADERIPLLLQTPAAIRFLSCEPLLGPVAIERFFWDDWHCNWCQAHLSGARVTNDEHCDKCGNEVKCDRLIDWVIAGGETGTDARPMHPDWVRSLRDQCVSAGVAFHFKQWGDHAPTRRHDNTCGPDRECLNREGHRQWIPSIPGYVIMDRVGVKRAGRELDGRTWDEFPAVRS